MRLILAGIEYAGKHTLALQIERWWAEQTGQDIGVGPHGRAAGSEDEQPRFHKFHDHFNIPYIMHTTGHHDDEQVEAGQKHVLTLPPGLMEYFQRYNIMNKFSLGYAVNYIEYPDMFFIDWYYGEAVYAPLYYGYGGVGEYGDRRKLARTLDKSVLKVIPDTVLVLMKASPEAIRKRFHERKSPFPHRHGATPFREEDTELVLERFEEEFQKSMLTYRFDLDTTDASVEETLSEFVRKIKPYITTEDRVRMLSRDLPSGASSFSSTLEEPSPWSGKEGDQPASG